MEAIQATGRDPSLLMGGSEAGSGIPLGSFSSYTAALGLDEALKNDPRALWSSFAMIIVRSHTPLTFLSPPRSAF